MPQQSKSATVLPSYRTEQTDTLLDNTQPIVDLMAQLIESKAEFEKRQQALEASKLSSEAPACKRAPRANECHYHCSASLQLNLSVPASAGYADKNTVFDFLSQLLDYTQATAISNAMLINWILPLALRGSAGV